MPKRRDGVDVLEVGGGGDGDSHEAFFLPPSMPILGAFVDLGLAGGSESESEPVTVADDVVDVRRFAGPESLAGGGGFECPPPRRTSLEDLGALETRADPSDELDEESRADCAMSEGESWDLRFFLGCLFIVCVSHD